MTGTEDLIRMARSVSTREDLEGLVRQLRRHGFIEGCLVTRFCPHGAKWCDGRHATGEHTWDEVLDWVRYTPGVREAIQEERRNPRGLPYLKIPVEERNPLQDRNITANKRAGGYSLGFGFTDIIEAIEAMTAPEGGDDGQ